MAAVPPVPTIVPRIPAAIISLLRVLMNSFSFSRSGLPLLP
jgi:hypothetical protein